MEQIFVGGVSWVIDPEIFRARKNRTGYIDVSAEIACIPAGRRSPAVRIGGKDAVAVCAWITITSGSICYDARSTHVQTSYFINSPHTPQPSATPAKVPLCSDTHNTWPAPPVAS